jgi:cytochrome b561
MPASRGEALRRLTHFFKCLAGRHIGRGTHLRDRIATSTYLFCRGGVFKMPAKTIDYDFFSDPFDWLFNGLVAVLLILGWTLQAISTQGEAHRFFFDLYLTLGAATAAFLFLHYLWHARFLNYPFRKAGPWWRKYLAYPLRQIIYGAVALLLAGGFLEILFSGAPIEFWGLPVEPPVSADPGLAGFFATLNQIAAFVLAGSLIIYAAAAVTSRFEARSTSTALVPERAIAPPSLRPPKAPPSAELLSIGQDLARRIRLFGWIGFWLDFFLALITAPLLLFGAVGKSWSPGQAWVIGEPLQWGFIALFLLFASLLVDFYSTIAARKLEAKPVVFLADDDTAFWFLGANSLIGLFGSIASFLGVGLSVALLIAKTVSQPPGIAITDPAKIVRALDVFILLGNFNLLLAHFLGGSGAVWLSTAALKARHRLASSRQLKSGAN